MDPGDGSLFRVEISSGGRICNLFPDSAAKIERVTISPGVTQLPDGLFEGCAAMNWLKIPEGVEEIRSATLAGCSGLKTLVLPDSVKRIAPGAFDDCPALEEMTMPKGLVDFRLSDIPERVLKSWDLPYDSNGLLIWEGVLLDCANKTVVELVIPTGVVGIASGVLSKLYKLTSVVLPEGLLEIGEGAFENDTKLKDVSFPDSLLRVGDRAFASCLSLTGATFGSKLREVGSGVFAECSKIMTLSLPGTLESVGDGAFADIESLTEVTVPTHLRPLKQILPKAYESIADVTVSEGSPFVCDEMFCGLSGIVSVRVPSSVTNVGARAFSACGGLVRLTFADGGLRTIGAQAFANCPKLAALDLPETVEAIADSAFDGCTGLARLSFGRSLRTLGDRALYNCSSLEAADMPGTLESVGSETFANCSSLTWVSLGPKVRSVGTSAFASCSGLPQISFPASVTNLANGILRNCSGLLSVGLPDGLLSIGDYAFDGTGLAEVVLPASVGTLGRRVFGSAGGLKRVYYLGNAPRAYDANVYEGTPGDFATYILDGSCGWDIVSQVYDYESEYYPETWPVANAHALTVLERPLDRQEVTFDANANGGGFDKGDGSFSASCVVRETPGCRYVFPSALPYAPGMRFDGWFDDVGREIVPGRTFETSGSRKVSARWIYNTSLDALNGVMEEGADIFKPGDEGLLLPVPRDEESRYFRGWYVGEKPVRTVGELVAAGGKAVGRWEPRVYFVKFDADGGTGTMPEQRFEYVEEQALAPNAFSRTGYVFVGWRKVDSDEDVVDFEDGASLCRAVEEHEGRLWLCAVWRPITYRVRFERGQGVGTMDEQVLTYDQPTALNHVLFTRTGCALEGWALADGGEAQYADGEVVANLATEQDAVVSLFARWCQAVTFEGTVVTVEKTTSGALREIFGLDYCGTITEVRIADGVTSLPAEFFADCDGIVSVQMSDTLRSTLALSDLWPSASVAVRRDDGFVIFDNWVYGHDDTTVTELSIPAGIAGIAKGAFAGFAKLKSVSFPDTLAYVGDQAFKDDVELDHVNLPAAVCHVGAEVFSGCTQLLNISLPDGLRTLGRRAFFGCANIQSLSLGSSLGVVADETFGGCWRMRSVSLPATVGSVGSSVFSGCTSLEGVTIPTHAGMLAAWFGDVCRQIKTVTVAPGETEVREGMFDGCSHLQEISFSEGVTNVGRRAFRGCGGLARLVLPESVVTVGAEAFRSCTGLTAFVLPANVKEVGSAAFRDCSRLSDVTLSRSLCALPDRLLDGCCIGSFVVPSSVTSIGANFCPPSAKSVFYLGNAPSYDPSAYAAAGSVTTYVVYGTTGWDGKPNSSALPQKWLGRPIEIWKSQQFDVTFDANGGLFAPVSSETYACEQITDTGFSLPPYNPTRKGYRFDGWWTERTGGARIQTTTKVTATRAYSVYAHWVQAPTVEVRFNAEGGTVEPDVLYYEADVPYGSFPVPTREHYIFTGWYSVEGRAVREADVVPSADHQFFAQWRPCTYVLRYHSNNGVDQTHDQTFRYGDTVPLWSGNFTCANCTFAGWSLTPGGEAVYGNGSVLTDVATIEDGVMHLWACWSGNCYAVRFDSHGGEGIVPNQTFVIGVAQPLSRNAFVRTGFVFGGWARSTDTDADYADGETVKDLTTEKNATVILYAVWVRSSGNSLVTFETNDGELENKEVEYVAQRPYGKLPVPVREGYAFVAWKTREGEVVTETSVVPQTDVTLYATWTANKYVVRFDANGGEGEMPDQAFAYDVPQALATNVFMRTDYTFMGWSVGEGADVVQYADGEVVNNLTTTADGVVTLRAVWKGHAYVVKFDANGGEGEMPDQAFVYDVPQALAGNLFVRAGYSFAGWTVGEDADGTVLSDGEVVNNLTAEKNGVVTLYATWLGDEITFDLPDGSTLKGRVGEKIALPDDFPKTGYKLVG